ncbi:cytochrome P450 [Pseudoxanthobacter sp. M-2]|uniref:cytochrome P450 n=1 Tax=Pseudoxanthobacter sp. M-2 TaxID=3078754 RepID=UPI0038FBF447
MAAVDLDAPSRGGPEPQTPGPPVWSLADQAWLVTRHADVVALLRDPCFAAANPADGIRRLTARTDPGAAALAGLLDGMAIFQNGATHAAVRPILKAYVAGLSAQWPAEAIEALVSDTLAPLAAGTTIDAVAMIADVVPNTMAARGLRLSVDDVARLRAMGQDIATIWRPLPPLREARRLEPVAAAVRALLAEAPRAVGRLPLAGTNDVPLADLEFFIITAVVETTASALGNAIDLLTRRPDLQERLRAEPGLVAGFVEEALRLAGPAARLNPRIATARREIGGQVLEAGAAVVAVLESAHRDPLAYSDPDTLQLDRRGPPLLAFGGGVHACLGARLARAEMAITLQRLVERFRLAPGTEPARRRASRDMLAFERLPVTLS